MASGRANRLSARPSSSSSASSTRSRCSSSRFWRTCLRCVVDLFRPTRGPFPLLVGCQCNSPPALPHPRPSARIPVRPSFDHRFCFFCLHVRKMVGAQLTTRSQLTAWVPFLEKWQEESSDSFNFVSGVLPPTVSALFGFFLPIIMRKLTRVGRLMMAVLGTMFDPVAVHGCSNALSPRPCSRRALLRLPGHLAAGCLHPDRRHLQYVYMFFACERADDVMIDCVKEIIRQVGKKSFSEIIHNLDSTWPTCRALWRKADRLI